MRQFMLLPLRISKLSRNYQSFGFATLPNGMIFLINLSRRRQHLKHCEALLIEPNISIGIQLRIDSQSMFIQHVIPSILNLSSYFLGIRTLNSVGVSTSALLNHWKTPIQWVKVLCQGSQCRAWHGERT